jgi:predicted small metal-binding protein
MRLYECGTLVPGCEWHTRADEDAEVVRRAVDHMRQAHGEDVIRENMVENIKTRIRNEDQVRPDPSPPLPAGQSRLPGPARS